MTAGVGGNACGSEYMYPRVCTHRSTLAPRLTVASNRLVSVKEMGVATRVRGDIYVSSSPVRAAVRVAVRTVFLGKSKQLEVLLDLV